jgi:tetraacyldisaccharide 4'-kinase
VREPAWWQSEVDSGWARALAPASRAYAALVGRRLRRGRPGAAALPVVCVGNFTVGGTGKTPMASAIAQLLADLGHRPAFLTRGYGGSERGPHWVDTTRDHARAVGDEPLLLARAFATMVCRDRPRGMAAIAATGRYDVVVMDDGLQNPSLAKTFTIALVDDARGFGNGRVLPAGPLRATLADQLPLVDVLLVVRGVGDVAVAPRSTFDDLGKPRLEARVIPGPGCPDLAGRRVVAWSGIAHPARFIRTLRSLGAELVAAEAMPDHRSPSTGIARRLLATAEREAAMLVTTEKDMVRLAGESGALAALREGSCAVPIAFAFSARDKGRLATMLRIAIGLALPTGTEPARDETARDGTLRRETIGHEAGDGKPASEPVDRQPPASMPGPGPTPEPPDEDSATVVIRRAGPRRSV